MTNQSQDNERDDALHQAKLAVLKAIKVSAERMNPIDPAQAREYAEAYARLIGH